MPNSAEMQDHLIKALEAGVSNLAEQLAEFTVSHNDAQQRLKRLEASLEENSSMTSELLEIFKAVKGGFKVLGWLGTALKWSLSIAAAAGALWAAWHPFASSKH